MQRLNELIRELQERKVFRVASIYLVTLWILIQGAIDLFPVFGIPDWSIRLLVIIGVVGFPVAVILSWAFQFTAEGLVRDDEQQARRRAAGRSPRVDFIVIGAGAVLVAFLMLRPQLTRIIEEGLVAPGESAAAATAAVKAPPPAPIELHPQSIAVLPFVNMSSDPDAGYFGDGMTEELLNVLANIPGLRVASRTSAFAFKDTQADIPTVSRKLEVAYVLEGSVRKSGERVRITAQLIDAREDVHLWSDTFDRELLEIFAVQDEISNIIVDTLKPTLFASRSAAPPPGRTTSDPEAYERYLRGRAAWRPDDEQALSESIAHLDASIARDSGFARAHSALARSLMSYAEFAPEPDAARQRGLEAARLAVRLDPSLREAHEILQQGG